MVKVEITMEKTIRVAMEFEATEEQIERLTRGENPFAEEMEKELKNGAIEYDYAAVNLDTNEDIMTWDQEVDIMYEKVKNIIKDNYNLSENDIEIATQDIVERCFIITGIPKDEELFDYIAEYLDRQEVNIMITDGVLGAVQMIIDRFKKSEEIYAGKIIWDMLSDYDEDEWRSMSNEEKAEWIADYVRKVG